MTQPGDNDVLRILHTSDWHLGFGFQQFRQAERERLRRARFDALDRLLGEARRHQVHAVLCAGDLFDDKTPPEAVWKALVAHLQAANLDCPVVFLPGNHDPLVEGSIWHANHPIRRALPANAVVVDHDDFVLDLPYDAQLFSRPTRSSMSSDDPLAALPSRAPGDERIRIALVHGQTFQIGETADNHPVDVTAAARLGFDYVALGDTHSFRELDGAGPSTVVYSGTPEQLRFSETDAGLAALVHIKRRSRRCRVDRRPIGTLKWRTEDVTELKALRSLAASDLSRTVLRLRVEGAFDAEAFREVKDIITRLEGDEWSPGAVAGLKLEDNSAIDDTNLETLLEEAPDELREAARLLKQARNDQTAPVAVIDRAITQLYRIAKEVMQ